MVASWHGSSIVLYIEPISIVHHPHKHTRTSSAARPHWVSQRQRASARQSTASVFQQHEAQTQPHSLPCTLEVLVQRVAVGLEEVRDGLLRRAHQHTVAQIEHVLAARRSVQRLWAARSTWWRGGAGGWECVQCRRVRRSQQQKWRETCVSISGVVLDYRGGSSQLRTRGWPLSSRLLQYGWLWCLDVTACRSSQQGAALCHVEQLLGTRLAHARVPLPPLLP